MTEFLAITTIIMCYAALYYYRKASHEYGLRVMAELERDEARVWSEFFRQSFEEAIKCVRDEEGINAVRRIISLL